MDSLRVLILNNLNGLSNISSDNKISLILVVNNIVVNIKSIKINLIIEFNKWKIELNIKRSNSIKKIIKHFVKPNSLKYFLTGILVAKIIINTKNVKNSKGTKSLAKKTLIKKLINKINFKKQFNSWITEFVL